MLDRGLLLWGENKAGPAGHTRQGRADAVEQGGDVLFFIAEGLIDGLTVFAVQIADLKNAVDKHPQADLRRNAARAGVGAVQEGQGVRDPA